MPPIPQEIPLSAPAAAKLKPISPSQLDDDDIVISGLSGLYPDCYNAKEFAEKLYNHENLTCSNPRWNYEHPELTKYVGSVPDLDKFDAQFFMVHYHLAQNTDMMSRKLLEQAYQAIFDSGTSPIELFGKNVGVYIGTSLTETEKLLLSFSTMGSGIMGCNRSMFANRISYWLNAKGPSMTLDASCSGSMLCVEKAYEAMKSGEIEAAIVGGCNIHLHPQACIHFSRMFGMNPDGKTKCFDQNADGPSPSECISVFFLQKAKDARRIYANLCNVKTEYSILDADYFERYGPFRDSSILSSFYNQFYEASNILPEDVEYVEAFGSAYPEADKKEMEAIQEVFCKSRDNPLLIGSVMSNMGFCYAATTVAALTKVCLAYQTGKIPANLHYVTPRDDIPAIIDGRMRVVTDNRPFGRSYAAINSLSLSGINGHMLLKGKYKPKDQTLYKSTIPYLLIASARQESGVELIFEDFKTNPVDPEVIALFHKMQKHHNTKHLARGYAILSSDGINNTVCEKEKADFFDDIKKPLWFVYSGMGSQWNGMGKELMRIPLFAASIKRCHKVLEPKGLDLIHIITTDDKKIFDNIIHSFVGISAVQIGLTDVLLSMGIVPDNLIGHSMGEMGCAYADGCVTAEEMILAAYYRGLVSTETPLVKGFMAAVGLGAKQMQLMCPPEVDVACHNSRESCTISGPYDVMIDFITKLNDQGIFAKAVRSSNKAYHSRYIYDAGPGLLKYLKTVIKNPKPRSQKWLSTSAPQEKWNEPAAQINSAEYHVNNMLVPVLFEETAEAIPDNAVLIEIAPHGLLQAILKRSLPSTCVSVPLTRRGHPDNVACLLEAVGELYILGYNPDLGVLYPKVEFPVSTETRSLSHVVEWVHDEKWNVPVHVKADRVHAAAYEATFSTYDQEFSFLKGHVINNETVLPISCALELVWDTLAMSLDAKKKQIPVQFNDVHFHAQPFILDHRLLKIRVDIHRGTGRFEVVNDNILVATGYVRSDFQLSKIHYGTVDNCTENMVYTSDDIYKILYNKGYCYRGEFRSIKKENIDMTRAIISWNENWTTLIDATIQMNLLRRNGDGVERPRFIQQLSIDLKKHNSELQAGGAVLEACYSEDYNLTQVGGVVLRNVLFTNMPPRESKDVMIGLSTLKFVPHVMPDLCDISMSLSIMLQILAENIDYTLNALDVTDQKYGSYLCNKMKNLQSEVPKIKLLLNKTTIQKIQMEKKIQALDFIIVDSLHNLSNIGDVIPSGTFIVTLEEESVSSSMYKVVASAMTPNGRLILARWKPSALTERRNIITVTSPKDIPKVKAAKNNLPVNYNLCILTHYPPMKELKDIVEGWKEDTSKNKVFLAMFPEREINDQQAKNLPNDFDLVYNVLQRGVWGGYYFICGVQRDDELLDSVSLRSAQTGNPDSLHWIEIPKPDSVNNIVSVHYSGFNLFDAKKAIGDIPTSSNGILDQKYGMDFSGITASGERVMGVVRGGAASTLVSADPTLLWPVPEHWTLEDAATVPLAYAHALYCLGVKCKLYYGMSVLVHGAAGALGQAVIAIALANKCTVFAAVNNLKKKQLLQKVFPNLPSSQIGYSRHEAFGDMVLTATEGKGCDIVISCVNGPLKNVSLSCCAAWGTTIDTQAIHSKENNTYGMYNMTKCRSYVATDFAAVFEPENYEERKQLKLMVSEGIARGFIRPLSRITYGAHEPARAIRLLAKSQHFGRVLLRIHGEAFATTKRLAISASGSHLVISATTDNDVAVKIVDLLIQRGAVNILLHNEHKTVREDAYMRFKNEQWKKLGANVNFTSEKINYEELIQVSNGLNPIDGIYAIVGSTSDKEANSMTSFVLADLDKITRKLCSTLRMFVIINNDTDIGRDICINRALDGLPALMLQLPKITKFNELNDQIGAFVNNKDSVLIKNIMPVVENSLCSAEPVAVLYTYTNESDSLIKEVSQMAHIKSEADYNVTLKELGLKFEQTQELLQLLQKYDIIGVPTESVLDLTLAQLNILQVTMEQNKYKVSTGLQVLFSSINTDELQATSDLVYLPTAAQNFTARGDEFDSNATFLVMIPGIDGHYGKFKTLCGRLKLSAAVLQPGLDHIHETVSEMAQRLVKVMLKRLCPKEKFYLLGYSFGVLVALEMAAILENYGMTGVVYCVDASPDSFPASMESWLREAGAKNTSQLQDAIVQHVITLLTGGKIDQLTEQLQETTAWRDKVEVGIRALRNKVPHSKQYARGVMESAYARIFQTRQYDSAHLSSLQSQIVLLRSRSNPYPSPDLGLARYSEHKPHVYYIEKDHAAALDDLQCAEMINKHLDEQVLTKFQKLNLCNAYLRDD